MQRVTNLPQVVLKQVLNRWRSAAETMTPTEISFAKRIMECCMCGHLWVGRSSAPPRRCPGCHSTQWNMALIKALADGFNNTPHAGKQEGHSK